MKPRLEEGVEIKVQTVFVQIKMGVISDAVSAVVVEGPKVLLYNSNILRGVIILVLKTIFSIVFKLCDSVLDLKAILQSEGCKDPVLSYDTELSQCPASI